MRLKLLFITSLIVLLGCKRTGLPKEFDYGQLENHVYSNEFFDFQMKVTEDWYVLSSEQEEELMQKGEDMVLDEEVKQEMKASKVNTAQLLSLFANPLDSVTGFNPSLLLIAENLRGKDLEDYLDETKEALEKMNMNYEVADGPYKHFDIGGEDFSLLDTEIDNIYMGVSQDYFVTEMNGFALMAIVSYEDELQRKKLMETLNSMNFHI